MDCEVLTLKIRGQLPDSVLFILFFLLSLAVSMAGWRVDSLLFLDKEENVLFSLPMACGQRFTTVYIHSVELTPVEDEYMVKDGAIWSWQERVKSSNAGMPFLKPERGKYIKSGDWMIFQGGRIRWERYHLRVGGERFGRNRLIIEPFGGADLYRVFPGERLTVTAKSAPLLFSRGIGVEKIYPAAGL